MFKSNGLSFDLSHQQNRSDCLPTATSLKKHLVWIAVASLAVLTGMTARPAPAAEPEIHYAPTENLEHVDLALIGSATNSLDIAAYTLTDWAIISALKDARARGVAIRIALDPSVRQAYDKLADMAEVVRIKKRGPLMHLKAYAVDGVLLRTGSANLSPSGLKQQDNDLVIFAILRLSQNSRRVSLKSTRRRNLCASRAKARSLLRVSRFCRRHRTLLVPSRATSAVKVSASIISRVTEIMTALS